MIQLIIPNPQTKTEILSSVDDISQQVSSFYSSLSLEIFFNAGLGGWSPAQNLSHITDITFWAMMLFKLPRLISLPFGKRKTGRDFQTLLKEYIGSKKVIPLGPLAPSSIPHSDGEQKVASLVTKWQAVCKDLKEILNNVSEKDLDEYSLPHPTLGMLSYREILYVTIIHAIHHSYKVEQKISQKSN